MSNATVGKKEKEGKMGVIIMGWVYTCMQAKEQEVPCVLRTHTENGTCPVKTRDKSVCPQLPPCPSQRRFTVKLYRISFQRA